MSPLTSASTTTRGQVLGARIKRITPIGMIAELDDGGEGLIREREIAWDAEARKGWRSRYRPGQVVQVVPLKEAAWDRPEYSLRLAHYDPWLDVEERYPIGALVEGVVTGIMPYGVFIELEPGVTGLLHTTRMPMWEKRKPGEVFWPGDLVKAEIIHLDPEVRKVSFSMHRLEGWRWQQTIPSPAPKELEIGRLSMTTLPDKRTPTRLTPLELLILHGVKTILIVDDNERQRNDIADWFRHAGQEVLTAANGNDAVCLARQSAPHLAVIDIHMLDMSGIETVQKIQSISPSTRCVLVTGDSTTSSHNDQLSDFQRSDVKIFLKPVLQEELLDVLFEEPISTYQQQEPAEAKDTRQMSAKPIVSIQSDSHWLTGILTQLRLATSASLAILFALEPGSRQVSVIAQSGRNSFHTGIFPDLIHSPIRDVAEDDVIVRAKDTLETNSRRFLHLHPYLRFAATIGVPVRTGYVNPHALFLFFDDPHPTLDLVEAQTQLAANAIEAKLVNQQLTARAVGLHRQAMIGQLTDVLTHELNNQRDIIPRTQRLLQDQLREAERHLDHSSDLLPGALSDIKITIQEFIKELDDLTKAVERLSGLGESEHPESVFLSEVIEEAVNLLRFLAKKYKITIEMTDTTKLSYVHTLRVSVRHVLINTILNAILQLNTLSRDRGGRVRISLESEDGKLYRINVEDDGPGIHRRLWEQIFDMGFTTRRGGRGLGLYVSRKLLDAFGARMYIQKSYIGWGSTFVIELPDVPF